MNEKIWYSIPIIILMSIGFLFVSYLDRDIVAPQTLLDQTVPAFEASTLDGKPVVFSEKNLKNRFVVLKFFATWCRFCHIEKPLLSVLASLPGIDLVGVALKEDPRHVLAWQQELNHPYKTILLDFEGGVAQRFFVKGVPVTFVINPQGMIVYRYQGPLTKDIIYNEIAPLILR